jgi:hypothetical protein
VSWRSAMVQTIVRGFPRVNAFVLSGLAVETVNLMVWSAADPTVQPGYKGGTEEECHGAIHAGY